MECKIIKCKACGNDFDKTQRKQKYCPICRKEGKEFACKICGKIVIADVNKRDAICNDCLITPCKSCGKPYKRNGNERYCPACREKGKKVKCVKCGNEMILDVKRSATNAVCDNCKMGTCDVCGKKFVKHSRASKKCDECKSFERMADDFKYEHKVTKHTATVKVTKKADKKKEIPTLADILKFQRDNNISSYGKAVIEWDKLHAV